MGSNASSYMQRAEALLGDAPETDEQAIERLASLSRMEYDRIRAAEAERLGIRVATLDEQVLIARAVRVVALGGNANGGQAFAIEDEDPHPDPVDADALLGELVALIRRHAIVPDGAALAVATWIFGTYVYDQFVLFPKLLVSSPEKRCGKSTLATVIGALVARALPCSNVTSAALFRCIDEWKPTLLLDEADTFLRDNEELRGILNAGHTRASAYVIRLCGNDYEPRRFSVWCPMLIAMIKLPPDTIVDRSVVIQMRRKMPGESVAKLPVSFRDDCRMIRQKLTRWAADHAGRLEQHPTVPHHLNDRTVDNWTPLFSITNAIGRQWTGRLEKSFRLLTVDDEDESIGPLILRDIRQVFNDKGIDRIFSDDLVTALVEMDESPWAEWNRGRPISKNTLARLLKPFKVYSERIRIGYDNKRGYLESRFIDAFARYLSDSPISAGTMEQPKRGAGFSDFRNGTPEEREMEHGTRKPSNGADCSDVPDEKGVFWP